jgi:hypothetical protein
MGVLLLVIERDTTIRVNTKTKEKLDNLDFARKNTSYNEIIDRLIAEYNKKSGGR